jgi:hypothetical protein
MLRLALLFILLVNPFFASCFAGECSSTVCKAGELNDKSVQLFGLEIKDLALLISVDGDSLHLEYDFKKSGEYESAIRLEQKGLVVVSLIKLPDGNKKDNFVNVRFTPEGALIAQEFW